MIWVTYIDPKPDDPEHVKHNFTGWKYTIEAGVLTLTKGNETTAFGPGFWVRLEDDSAVPKKTVKRLR